MFIIKTSLDLIEFNKLVSQSKMGRFSLNKPLRARWTNVSRTGDGRLFSAMFASHFRFGCRQQAEVNKFQQCPG